MQELFIRVYTPGRSWTDTDCCNFQTNVSKLAMEVFIIPHRRP